MGNNHPAVTLPGYVRLTVAGLGVIALFFVLYIGKSILVPLLFALLVAMLLNPLVERLAAHGVNRILAIALTVIAAMTLLGGLAYFITDQVMHFSESMDGFKENLRALGNEVKSWVQDKLHMERGQVEAAVQTMKDEGMNKGGSIVGATITTIGTVFAFFFLLPVYTFLILLYKRLFLQFIARLFPEKEHGMVTDVLGRSKLVIQSYLLGLMLEAVIVAGLNVTGLLIIGVEYALLLGVIGALLNMVPYIGGLVATGLAMMVALATMEPSAALWVLLLFLVVQFVDNNFIVPRIVASRVEINALASILAVLVGGALWSVPGMFLSLPVIAIVKVVCDRIPAAEPFGYLLGDDQPRPTKMIFKRTRTKATKEVARSTT